MSGMGKYMYGVINSDCRGESSKVPASHGMVYTIPYKGVSAVVSDAEMVEYAKMPGDTAARHLVNHQLVLERMMKDHNTIPIKLGTYLLNEGEVTQALARGHGVFQKVFKEIEGRVEFNVVATWTDLNTIIREVSRDKEITALKEALLTNAQGITVDAQIKIGILIRNHLNTMKAGYSGAILDALEGLAERAKDYTTPDDATIMNAALLLARDAEPQFDEKLEELSVRFEGKVHFKVIGPLPPYNFYTLEIKKFQFDEIDCARRKLGLPDFAVRDDIKKAYRKYAFDCHPDRQSEKWKAEMEYDEAAKAYKLLTEYCQDDACSFRADDFFNNSIAIKLKGQ